MKTYYLFENKGEVDNEIIQLFGLSTKTGDDTKIGQWGSGLKYAIAKFLREDIEIRVFSGEKEIKVSKKKKTIGSGSKKMTVEVITFDGKETSLTTQMGFDWELWFAMREIYANMIDEGGTDIQIDNEIKPRKGFTRIYVMMSGKTNIDMNRYFLLGESPISTFKVGREEIEVYKNSYKEFLAYHKGVQCYNAEPQSKFRYSSNKIEINESRVAKYSWDAAKLAGFALLASGDRFIIETIMDTFKTSEECYEKKDLCYDISYKIMTDESREIISEILKRNSFCRRGDVSLIKRVKKVDLVLPDELFSLLQKCGIIKQDDEPVNKDWEDVQQSMPGEVLHDMMCKINKDFFDGKLDLQVSVARQRQESRDTEGLLPVSDDPNNQKNIILNEEFVNRVHKNEVEKELLRQMIMKDSDCPNLSKGFEDVLIEKIYLSKYNK